MEETLQLKKISCSNCGAELIFDPSTQMTNCNFCGSKFEIEQATNEEVLSPDCIVPFKTTKEEYHQAVLRWLSEGDYTPDDILTSSAFEEINGIFLPMYFFKGNYHGHWNASSGYTKTETVWRYSSSEKKNVQESKTVTDWRPSNGQVVGKFAILGFAGVGESIKPEIIAFVHETHFEKESLKSYDSKYTLGFNLLKFNLDEENVWGSVGVAQADSLSTSEIQKRIPGDKFKDLSSDVSYDREETIKAYIPCWIVNYKYADKEFYVCMDGIKSSRICGERPIDKGRKSRVKKFFLPSHIVLVVWLAVWLFYAFNESEGIAWPVFGIGLGVVTLLYIISFRRKKLLLKASKLSREKILKSMASDESGS